MSGIAAVLEGRVYRLTLDIPPVNVLSLSHVEELATLLKAAPPEAKVVLISAEGKLFSAGIEVADHLKEKAPAMLASLEELFLLMGELEPVTIAAVRGACLGGACEIAAACDVVLASERAKFGLPEISLAVYPPYAVALFERLLGPRAAFELIFTGRTYTAEEAQACGLVTRLLPEESFEAALTSELELYTSKSSAAVKLAKRALRECRGLPERDALKLADRVYLDELMETADANEGLAAFLQKREPEWEEG